MCAWIPLYQALRTVMLVGSEELVPKGRLHRKVKTVITEPQPSSRKSKHTRQSPASRPSRYDYIFTLLRNQPLLSLESTKRPRVSPLTNALWTTMEKQKQRGKKWPIFERWKRRGCEGCCRRATDWLSRETSQSSKDRVSLISAVYIFANEARVRCLVRISGWLIYRY